MTIIASRRSAMMLFSSPSCCFSHRTRIVLAEKGINVDIRDVDSDHPPEDLLDLNPQHSLPTLVDRDLVLYDSRVIMEYLDERFPHPPLMPIDPVSRARARLALYRVENDWYPLIPDLEGGSEKKRAEARKRMRENLVASAEVFAAKPFFLSDEYSLVDASIVPILWRLGNYGINLPDEARPVMEYAERMFLRDGFELSLSDAEKEMGA